MKMACLDLEWVLIPEIWEELGKLTWIQDFMLTTRDISDYDVLMKMRLQKMEENNLTLTSIKEIVWTLEPLYWAIEFMKWLRERMQVTILTGSYYEYIMPLLEKLDYPCTFANWLQVENDKIVWYSLREPDWKIEMINRFHAAGFETIAIWDSYNDLAMIEAATKWIFFRPAPKLEEEMNGRFTITHNYEQLKIELKKII